MISEILLGTGFIFVLMYLFDKNGSGVKDKKDSGDNDIMLRHLALVMGITFVYLATLFTQTLVATNTVSSIGGNTITYYIYNNTYIPTSFNQLVSLDISPLFVLSTIFYVVFLIFVLVRGGFDVLDTLVDKTSGWE